MSRTYRVALPGNITAREAWADVKPGTTGRRFRIQSITYAQETDTSHVEYSEVQP